jgi:Zn-dependent metalloprotease
MKKTKKVTKVIEEKDNKIVETITTQTIIEYKKAEEEEKIIGKNSTKIQRFDILSISSEESFHDSEKLMKIKEDSNENSCESSCIIEPKENASVYKVETFRSCERVEANLELDPPDTEKKEMNAEGLDFEQSFRPGSCGFDTKRRLNFKLDEFRYF